MIGWNCILYVLGFPILYTCYSMADFTISFQYKNAIYTLYPYIHIEFKSMAIVAKDDDMISNEELRQEIEYIFLS